MADIPHVSGEVEKILAEDRFLRSLAASLVGAGPDADDAAQHAWLRSLEHPPPSRIV
jgi:DNA-directed RNA polymerase specialized sigma24 family protein